MELIFGQILIMTLPTEIGCIGNIIYNLSGSDFAVSSAQHLIRGNELHNNVSINTKYGINHTGDDNLLVNKHSSIGIQNHGHSLNAFYKTDCATKYDKDWGIRATVKNSSFYSGYGGLNANSSSCGYKGLTSTYNNFYSLTRNYGGAATQGSGDIFIDPNYPDSSTYGKGAYLIAPVSLKGKGENGANIGAEVLYRYQNSVLTDTPLWPWPMEDRIFRETGVSVTWEANGGLWKTLNGVYETQLTTSTSART
jgi:hypothetical protein